MGRSEVEHEFRKKYRETEVVHTQRMKNIKDQYEYILKERESEIARFLKEFEDYEKLKKSNIVKLSEETMRLYDVAMQQHRRI